MRRVAVTFGNPEKLPPYEEAIRTVGLEPVRNPESLAGLEGLVVTGGTDVDPKLYGEEAVEETQEPDTNRDELESRLIREALALDRPVLAICRGMQIFNVVHRGSLHQHLFNASKHEVRDRVPSADVHSVEVKPDTMLAAAIGAGSKQVNSRHHQAIARLGERLIESAVSADGVIEGLERPDKRFAVAVQWHPEDRIHTDATDLALFQAFAAALKE
jgi:gamma-glutamyl-gamma-aminobutyrate hydrolase PuuD